MNRYHLPMTAIALANPQALQVTSYLHAIHRSASGI